MLEARATQLAAEGRRTWQPSPERPALVIVIDEYAELADDAPEAAADADSVARLGRAVAVSMIAATQRPTQKAMGQGAVRSQMDIRISFRVRERKDVDLILGQGMLAAGWQAHKLDAPGKFPVASAEHRTPRRARAYLITDQAVTETAARHAELRPELDEASQCAMGENAATTSRHRLAKHRHTVGRANGTQQSRKREEERLSEAILWAALSLARDEGDHRA